MISRRQTICLITLALLDVLLGIASVWYLPERVPVHWDFRGQVDRYGPPWELALLLPGFIVATTGLLLALPALGTRGAALQRSGMTYGRMAIVAVLALIAIHVLAIVRGRTQAVDFGSAVVAAVGVLSMMLGNWSAKLRRNSLAGIRTPWTLKSDEIWDRTNRLGARLQVAHGIVVVLAAVCFPFWAAISILLGGLIALVVWAYFYSWSLARASS